jgi:hypothetical protein
MPISYAEFNDVTVTPRRITNFRIEGRKIVETPIFNGWLSGIESWKEVLQEAEAHIATCSVTDDDGMARNITWDFEVNFYAIQKRIGELLDAGYTRQFELFHMRLRKSSTWVIMLSDFSTMQQL